MGTETMTPVDATHVGPGGVAYKSTGASCWIWQGKLWSLIMDLPAQAVQIKREWNGEGLPPVGMVCEIWYDDGRVCWQEAEVFGRHPTEPSVIAVRLMSEGQRNRLAWADKFRPIRTADQIAAEERKNGIRAMMDAIGFSRTVLSNKDCEILWDAGYRPTHS